MLISVINIQVGLHRLSHWQSRVGRFTIMYMAPVGMTGLRPGNEESSSKATVAFCCTEKDDWSVA